METPAPPRNPTEPDRPVSPPATVDYAAALARCGMYSVHKFGPNLYLYDRQPRTTNKAPRTAHLVGPIDNLSRPFRGHHHVRAVILQARETLQAWNTLAAGGGK